MKKIKWLSRNCHVLAVQFALCLSEKDFKVELARLKIKEDVQFMKNWHSSATAHYIEQKEKQNALVIVCMGEALDKPLDEVIGLLAHEAAHIWQYHKELIGEENPSKEFEAYAIQSIVQHLVSSYFEMTGRGK